MAVGFQGTIIILLVLAALGLVEAIIGKALLAWNLSTDKYSEEALKKFGRGSGICTLILGLAAAGFVYFFHEAIANEQSQYWPVVGILVLVVIGSIIAHAIVRKKTLK